MVIRLRSIAEQISLPNIVDQVKGPGVKANLLDKEQLYWGHLGGDGDSKEETKSQSFTLVSWTKLFSFGGKKGIYLTCVFHSVGTQHSEVLQLKVNASTGLTSVGYFIKVNASTSLT